MMIQIVIIRVRGVEAGLQMLIWQEKSQGDYDHDDLGDLVILMILVILVILVGSCYDEIQGLPCNKPAMQ